MHLAEMRVKWRFWLFQRTPTVEFPKNLSFCVILLSCFVFVVVVPLFVLCRWPDANENATEPKPEHWRDQGLSQQLGLISPGETAGPPTERRMKTRTATDTNENEADQGLWSTGTKDEKEGRPPRTEKEPRSRTENEVNLRQEGAPRLTPMRKLTTLDQKVLALQFKE